MFAKQYSQSELMSYRFIQNMAEPSRDCSKSRPTTFGEITFSISQEIDNKIKIKNIGLRKAAWSRLQEQQKNIKSEETKPEISSINFQKGPFNYLELYKPQKKEKDRSSHCPEPELCKLDDRDQETTLQIYLLIKKRKPIFKVQEVKRKLRSKDAPKRMNYKQCQCCGVCGRHRCTHILCQKKCAFFMQPIKSEELSVKEQGIQAEEPQQLVAIAQQLINEKEVEAPQIQRVQITVKEQQIVIPQIDVIDDAAIKKELEQNPNDELDAMGQGVVETERISEVQSKSEVSESRRHRSEFKEGQNIEIAQNNGEGGQEEVKLQEQHPQKKQQ